MVRSITFLAFTAIAGFVNASSQFRRTVADVVSDLNDIKAQVIVLDNNLKSFVGANQTVSNALDINTASNDLNDALQKATSDVQSTLKNNGPPTTAEAQNIINIVNSFKPQILDSLQQLIDKYPAFSGGIGLDASSLVLADLINLDTSNQAFENQLIIAAPASLRSQAEQLAKDIDAAFVPAIKKYGGDAPVRTPPVFPSSGSTLPTSAPTSAKPTSTKPTSSPTSAKPTSIKPTSKPTSAKPTSTKPTSKPTSAKPTSTKPTSAKPTSTKQTSSAKPSSSPCTKSASPTHTSTPPTGHGNPKAQACFHKGKTAEELVICVFDAFGYPIF